MLCRKTMDVVYILKNGIDPYELRYSLRSLKNFPHDRVWFYGGDPVGIRADRQVVFDQEGSSKWDKVRNSLRMVCMNEDITSSFWLFNDDFFCMKPCKNMLPIYHGTLQDRVKEIQDRRGTSPYAVMLQRTESILREAGKTTLNYAVHVPLLVDRSKALEVLKGYSSPMFRSIYGNHCSIGGEDRADVKIYKTDEEPDHDAEWLSTTNESFKYGAVGRYIREQFKEASRYEIGQTSR